ncbi:MAG: prepilin-type N-terminal cleavage/methylation domain-containing protein [Candidatus Gastranaerophilales bacterium]|nr:prepilin-type N-terminal cleavage/methylation domain-containing protein [Candidatus Gastranaerophilales bacterium]
MRNKKAFTLAEILIVLMVIGVIATLTIPSLMKGVMAGQYKSGYKKALKEISTMSAAEKIAGSLPTSNRSSETLMFFEALNTHLSVNGYISFAEHKANTGSVLISERFDKSIRIKGRTYGTHQEGDIAENVNENYITTYEASPWIITDDNMAYSVMCGGDTGVRTQCATTQEINAQPTQKDAARRSCAIVIVDVNGLSKGPNRYDPQLGPDTGVRLNTFNAPVESGEPLDTLTGDQYIIFIGSDGATAGPSATSVTGRIASGAE